MRASDEHSELVIIGVLISEPSLYLEELCQRVLDLTSMTILPSSVCRLMRHYGITRKRIRQVALQRCNALLGACMAQCTVFSRQFVWVDETGIDERDHIRKYGYAIQGTTPVTRLLFAHGQRVNTIAALSAQGVIAVEIVTGSVNGENFIDFLRDGLIPHMMPFDDRNPNSTLMMDNCSVHHVHEVIDLLRQSGVLLLFLRPYSPDLNPAEEAFSYIKGYLIKLYCNVALALLILYKPDLIQSLQTSANHG